jgi:hypothetical protein
LGISFLSKDEFGAKIRGVDNPKKSPRTPIMGQNQDIEHGAIGTGGGSCRKKVEKRRKMALQKT